jgi:hypothetical protein
MSRKTVMSHTPSTSELFACFANGEFVQFPNHVGAVVAGIISSIERESGGGLMWNVRLNNNGLIYTTFVKCPAH